MSEPELMERLTAVLARIARPMRLSELVHVAELDDQRRAAEEAVSTLVRRAIVTLDKDLRLSVPSRPGGDGLGPTPKLAPT